jgi:hypothetical protein
LSTPASSSRSLIPDLVACWAAERERFERELHRLRGYRFKRLLVVGTERDVLEGRYRSRITPAAVLGSLGAFEVRYDVPVVFLPHPGAGSASNRALGVLLRPRMRRGG